MNSRTDQSAGHVAGGMAPHPIGYDDSRVVAFGVEGRAGDEAEVVFLGLPRSQDLPTGAPQRAAECLGLEAHRSGRDVIVNLRAATPRDSPQGLENGHSSGHAKSSPQNATKRICVSPTVIVAPWARGIRSSIAVSSR